MIKAKEKILKELSRRWLDCKDREEEERAARAIIEEQIAAFLPGPDEGTESIENCGLRISVIRKLTRTIDMEVYEEVKDFLPQGLSPVKFKADLDLKKYRAIESANPEIFKVCQKFVTVKPAKALIKIEEVSE